MNDESLNLLFARARQTPPDTSRAEFGFETRLLAGLRDERSRKAAAPLVWRLCPWFAVAVAVLGFWTLLQPPDIGFPSVGQADDLLLNELLTGTTP